MLINSSDFKALCVIPKNNTNLYQEVMEWLSSEEAC